MASQAKINYSIHPRNHYMVDKSIKRGEKVNTCAPRNDSRKGTLAFREKNRNARRNDMARIMSQPKNATSYRVPGSMRGW